MKDGKTLVIVEVKLKSNHQLGSATSSIIQQKQQKLILAAQYFFQLHAEKIGHPASSFDAALMN